VFVGIYFQIIQKYKFEVRVLKINWKECYLQHCFLTVDDVIWWKERGSPCSVLRVRVEVFANGSEYYSIPYARN